jgi:hypothetical protein
VLSHFIILGNAAYTVMSVYIIFICVFVLCLLITMLLMSILMSCCILASHCFVIMYELLSWLLTWNQRVVAPIYGNTPYLLHGAESFLRS